MYILEKGTEMTKELLLELLEKHKSNNEKYEKLKDLYEGKHPILNQKKKEAYKPDNRVVVNYAKYIVDTLNGFFIGIPIKISHENLDINEYLNMIDKLNNQDDNNAELSKLCLIYGHAYELLFIDEDGDLGITYIKPQESFVVYDNSIVSRPLFGVRFYKDTNERLAGSFSDKTMIQYFHQDEKGNLIYDEVVPHLFGDVPLHEYVQNEEKIGAIEGVESLINSYNKALSEKLNDVDYFADAYLKILGALLDEDNLKTLRDSRIINLTGDGIDDKVIVEFMEKPNADQTQENTLDRIERLIFQMAMVVNINEEKFGTQSGVALKHKLQPMENLTITKERKFTAGLNKRYSMIASTGLTPIKKDDWVGIRYKFTRNYPSDLLSESEVAKNLMGVTSHETILKGLSIVEDAKEELERINNEYPEDIYGDE